MDKEKLIANIPQFLKEIDAWCNASRDKIPFHPITKKRVNEYSELVTFGEAVSTDAPYLCFKLDSSMGFSVVDVDCPLYAEHSINGGLHIITKYPSIDYLKHYIIFTGSKIELIKGS